MQPVADPTAVLGKFDRGNHPARFQSSPYAAHNGLRLHSFGDSEENEYVRSVLRCEQKLRGRDGPGAIPR